MGVIARHGHGRVQMVGGILFRCPQGDMHAGVKRRRAATAQSDTRLDWDASLRRLPCQCNIAASWHAVLTAVDLFCRVAEHAMNM